MQFVHEERQDQYTDRADALRPAAGPGRAHGPTPVPEAHRDLSGRTVRDAAGAVQPVQPHEDAQPLGRHQGVGPGKIKMGVIGLDLLINQLLPRIENKCVFP